MTSEAHLPGAMKDMLQTATILSGPSRTVETSDVLDIFAEEGELLGSRAPAGLWLEEEGRLRSCEL